MVTRTQLDVVKTTVATTSCFLSMKKNKQIVSGCTVLSIRISAPLILYIYTDSDVTMDDTSGKHTYKYIHGAHVYHWCEHIQ